MTSTGELIKGLRVTSRSHARPGTLSSAYGSGEFPLHTDTAFWPLPARYLVFRVQGDNRRRTTVLSFADVFQQCSPPALLLAEKAIWLVRTKLGSFYCSLRIQGHCGWRYDGACMFPAIAARELRGLLYSPTASGRGANINWQRDEALVLLNWSVLHGRGPSPEDEKRAYPRKNLREVIRMSWERDPLWAKAKLFFERAFEESPEDSLFGLWASMDSSFWDVRRWRRSVPHYWQSMIKNISTCYMP